MQETYRKRLTLTEAKRYYVYIETDALWLFPSVGEPFKIRIGKKEYEVEIGSENRIWGALFRDYIEFEEGNIFVFKKNADGSFDLSVEK